MSVDVENLNGVDQDYSAVAPIDPQDPLLAQRKILVSARMSEATAKDIVQRLFYLDALGSQPINLYLNTAGGPSQYAFAVIDVMRQIKAPVNTFALGNCHSAGALILACGTGRRTALPHAIIGIHGPIKVGKVPDEYAKIVEERMETLWRERTRLPNNWYPLRGDVNHFLTAEKAREYGVIDDIPERVQ